MHSPSQTPLPELGPSMLAEAYLILARQTGLLPTVEHLEALDQMHRNRYDQLLDEVNALEAHCRQLQDGLSRLALAVDHKREGW